MNLLVVFSLIMFFFSLFLFFLGLLMEMFKFMILFEWVIDMINSMKFSYLLYLDWMGLMYISVVLFISGFIMIYSVNYMSSDMNLFRFIYLLLLFILSMCLMILSPSLLSIMLGWDGLGFISYCLVIYYQNSNSMNSGTLTILSNRVGDVGILMLIGVVSMNGSWHLLLYSMSLLCLFMLVLAIITKSAQLPFSSWLPVAMTAPTPISSLVHSSTLVTAGVYLFIRFNDFFYMNDSNILLYLFLIFSFTMFMSGLMANFEMNIKKIIALSTLSQLGFMMSILSMGYIELGFFHMLIHAFFKSLMFMCIGSFIHSNMNSQDLRMLSGLFYLYPLKSIVLIFSILNLCGFPFLSGFYSKDLILEFYLINEVSIIGILMMYLSTIFTISYSIRLILILINKNKNMFMYMYLMKMNFMYVCKFFLMLLIIFLGMMYVILVNKEFFFLMVIDKELLIYLMFMGYMFNFYLSKIKYKMTGIFFIISMFYLNILYKIIYIDLMKKINIFLYYEKMIEMLMGYKLVNFYLMYKILKKTNSWNNYLNLVILIQFYVFLVYMVILMTLI